MKKGFLILLLLVPLIGFSQESRTQLKSYFETGDVPTEAQFESLIDSFHNLEDDSYPVGIGIDSARVYDSLAVHRDSIDDISNYLHGLSQDYWPLSGNFLIGSANQIMTVPNNYYLQFSTGSSAISGIFFDETGFINANGNIVANQDLIIGWGSFLTPSQYFLFGDTDGNTTFYGGIQPLKYGGLYAIPTDSSIIHKLYSDSHLGTKNLSAIAQNPTASENGKLLAWYNGAAEWDTVTVSGGGVVWGGITGTLSSQTDLQGELDAKIGIDAATYSITGSGSWSLQNTTGTVNVISTAGSIALTQTHTAGSISLNKNNAGDIQITKNSSGAGTIDIENASSGDVSLRASGTGTITSNGSNNPASRTDSTIVNEYRLNKFVASYFSGSLTDGTPTDAQIDGIIGSTPATVGTGRKFTIKDTDGSGLLYTVISDGTNWYYVAMTQAN